MVTRPGDYVRAGIESAKAGVSSEGPERVGEHHVVVVVPPSCLHPLGRDYGRSLTDERVPGRPVRPRGEGQTSSSASASMPSGIRTAQPMLESSGSPGGGVRRRTRRWTSSTCMMLASQPSTRSASQLRPRRLAPIVAARSGPNARVTPPTTSSAPGQSASPLPMIQLKPAAMTTRPIFDTVFRLIRPRFAPQRHLPDRRPRLDKVSDQRVRSWAPGDSNPEPAD
jgi:hypothetical protein